MHAVAVGVEQASEVREVPVPQTRSEWAISQHDGLAPLEVYARVGPRAAPDCGHRIAETAQTFPVSLAIVYYRTTTSINRS